MSRTNECKTCTADNQDELEALGREALSGERSWNSVMKELGWTNIGPLRNHMERHYAAQQEREVAQVEAEVEDEFQESIDAAVSDLFQQMKMAPPEVKGLYAAAIRNLQGLRQTKPSQQHLIMALKAIQEMTGMKQEQRLLVQFAEHMFRELPQTAAKALPLPAVIDVESV